MKFYNVHTHVAKNTPDEIRNVIFGWDDPVSKGYYCVGAHPLFYEWTKDFYSKLLKMCTPKAAVAVGECGFDKRSPMPFSEQTEPVHDPCACIRRIEKTAYDTLCGLF